MVCIAVVALPAHKLVPVRLCESLVELACMFLLHA
jgi:hypothetical protein